MLGDQLRVGLECVVSKSSRILATRLVTAVLEGTTGNTPESC